MNILIAGGSYFIGWDVLKKLNMDIHQVFVLNRGTHSRVYEKNVKHIVCDRNNQAQLKEELADCTIDIVVDFSAFNEKHVTNLLDALDLAKLTQYIYISSAAVYLESQILPIKEGFATGRHRSWGEYGESKLRGELAVKEGAQSYGFKYTIVRPSYVYGPGNYVYREDFFFDRISQNRPILMPGDGNTLLQLGYLTDLSEVIVSCVNNIKVMNEVLNISGAEMITFQGLIQLICNIMDKNPPKIHAVNTNELRIHEKQIFPFETSTYFISNEKATNLLGYSPKVDLSAGLFKSCEYWKKGKPAYKKGLIDENLEKIILATIKQNAL